MKISDYHRYYLGSRRDVCEMTGVFSGVMSKKRETSSPFVSVTVHSPADISAPVVSKRKNLTRPTAAILCKYHAKYGAAMQESTALFLSDQLVPKYTATHTR